jgi:hypothetical protein
MNRSLGRMPHDPVRIAAERPHVMSATAPAPLVLSRPAVLAQPSLVFNDSLPTCTVAGLINCARAWAQLHGFDLTYTDDACLAFFAKVAGCDNTIEAIAKVPGLVMQDVLDYGRVNGFDCGGPVILEYDYQVVDPHDEAAIRDVISLDGGAYVGIDVYARDMADPDNWNTTVSTAGELVGGHCLVPKDYTTLNYDAVTWGEDLQMTNVWLDERIQEVFRIEWLFPIA